MRQCCGSHWAFKMIFAPKILEIPQSVPYCVIPMLDQKTGWRRAFVYGPSRWAILISVWLMLVPATIVALVVFRGKASMPWLDLVAMASTVTLGWFYVFRHLTDCTEVIWDASSGRCQKWIKRRMRWMLASECPLEAAQLQRRSLTMTANLPGQKLLNRSIRLGLREVQVALLVFPSGEAFVLAISQNSGRVSEYLRRVFPSASVMDCRAELPIEHQGSMRIGVLPDASVFQFAIANGRMADFEGIPLA